MRIIENPSPNYSERKSGTVIDTVVLHYTGMKSADEAMTRMKNSHAEVSAHYCINENGRVYKLVDEKYKAWHAGVSHWRGRDYLNNNSIGIEIVNPGHEHGYRPFSYEQGDAVTELVSQIFQRHNIDVRNVVGHSDIAPQRKEDPGEYFPWFRLAEKDLCIFPDIKDFSVSYQVDAIEEGEESSRVSEIQENLAKIGYLIENTGEFDKQTKKVVTAFYRRFFPGRITTCKKRRYPEDIKWDIKSDKICDQIISQYKKVD